MAFLYQVIMKKRNLQNERKQLPLTIQRCIDVANYYIGSSSSSSSSCLLSSALSVRAAYRVLVLRVRWLVVVHRYTRPSRYCVPLAAHATPALCQLNVDSLGKRINRGVELRRPDQDVQMCVQVRGALLLQVLRSGARSHRVWHARGPAARYAFAPEPEGSPFMVSRHTRLPT